MTVEELMKRQMQVQQYMAQMHPGWGERFRPAPPRETTKPAVCECGSTACGSAAHSDWCPLYEAGQ